MSVNTRRISNGVVAHRPGQMYGWPGITMTNKGDILVIASERKFHNDPYGRIVVARSKDKGNTWSGLEEIYNSLLDDRDGSLLATHDNIVIASWFTEASFCEMEKWSDRSEIINKEIKDKITGSWMLLSEDEGYTWEDTPRRMPDGGANHIGPYLLPDNKLGCFGYELADDTLAMYFYESSDKGLSWERKGQIMDTGSTEKRKSPCWRLGNYQPVHRPIVNERSLLALDSQRYITMFRSFDGYLRVTSTYDGGNSWNNLEKLPVFGGPAHLLKLKDGSILCSFSYRKEPYSILGIISRDGGTTWANENIFTIYSWDDKPDMGYPVSVETSPGEILTVFYSSYSNQELTSEVNRNGKEGLLFQKFQLVQA